MEMDKRLILGIVLGGVLVGCQAPTQLDIPITIQRLPSPTVELVEPTPMPPAKTLIVCMRQEPASLYLYNEDYLYGTTGGETNTILQAIYDGPIDLLQDEIHPVILEGLPELDSDTAHFESVEVAELDVYLNPVTLQAENLRLGGPFLPSGCASPDCIQTYQGGLVSMDRMVVDFQLREEVRWSDGEAVTAGDSVFSYELDREGASPTTKYLVDRTHSYEVLDDRTVRWSGIPGYADLEFQTIFWHPLPGHRYEGLGAEEMQVDAEANSAPMGWGPYVIGSWVEGDRIEMVRNPEYFRQIEGLPYFDRLIFRFLGSDPRTAVQQLLTTECDVLDESLLTREIWPTLIEYQQEGRVQLLSRPAAEVLRLDFNSAPLGRAGEAFFQTAEARQAVAACVNRQSLAETTMQGLGAVPSSFHTNEATFGEQVPGTFDFDPQRGQELIRFLGWVDEDEDPETAYVSSSVPGVYKGKRFEISMIVPDDDLYLGLGQEIQTMLFECGIQVTLEPASAENLTAIYPDGDVFGRKFDAVLWSWPDWRLPLCEMFATREIPTESYPYGVNASGFSNAAYDLACGRVLLGDFDRAQASILEIQTIFDQQLPALPMLQPPRLLVAGVNLCGLDVDPIAPSLLWNLETIASGDGCR